jgi:hypothetical protein
MLQAWKKRDWLNWLKLAGIRALKTFAQTFIALVPTTAVVLNDVPWLVVLSGSALAAVLSLVMSLAGLPEESVIDDGNNK